MHKLIAIVLITLALPACRKQAETQFVPLPTSVHLRTMHHDIPVAAVNVFIKYNAAEFPGYDKAAAYFDTVLVSDINGKVELHPVQQGHHWAVAFGSSEHGIPLPIYGSMPLFIDADKHPGVDTSIYMFE